MIKIVIFIRKLCAKYFTFVASNNSQSNKLGE